MTTAAGLVSALLLLLLLVDRELRRVAMDTVGPVPRPRVGRVTISLWFEVVLWVASAALLLPRVVGFLT